MIIEAGDQRGSSWIARVLTWRKERGSLPDIRSGGGSLFSATNQTDQQTSIDVTKCELTDVSKIYILVSRYGRTLRIILNTDPTISGEGTGSGRLSAWNETQKIPGTTTSLYVRAKKLIQDEATHMHKPIRYTFRTKNVSLIRWALDPDKGGAIFLWDHKGYAYQGGVNEFVASTLIQPRTD